MEVAFNYQRAWTTHTLLASGIHRFTLLDKQYNKIQIAQKEKAIRKHSNA
jgi:hypothetical protein